MTVRVRWQLYRYWLNQYESYLKNEMEDLILDYLPLYKNFNEVQEDNNLALIRHQKIIGMTTTMAARMHSVLKQVKCPIVIVEEAAEVLEAHIIPVLTGCNPAQHFGKITSIIKIFRTLPTFNFDRRS